MTTTFITGANKGLGKETARQLIAAGHTVLLGARDENRGMAAAAELGATFIRIDVTDGASVARAAERIAGEGGIDVLINNAGVEGRGPGNTILAPAETTAEDVRAVFDVNVFGTMRVTHALLPLLERSAAPVIVNVASGLASLSMLSDPSGPTHFYPGIAYPASKAVVNTITIQLAKALPRFRVNSVEPGFTRTDLNGNTGTQSVEVGARHIVRMAMVSPDGPTGTFASGHGDLPW
ncbi:SDR family NAD(P)-dependent oxidoreductase [Microbacterium soli]|uniref:SDR family NAD(P)-dependent oxidoreductase n=1 Tax=Microbacterium soli TaxID=446075 RepID=A0ABP7NDU0_9MICO